MQELTVAQLNRDQSDVVREAISIQLRTQQDLDRAGMIFSGTQALIRRIDQHYEPLDEQAAKTRDAIRRAWADLKDPLLKAKDAVKEKMDSYRAEVAALERAERIELAREAGDVELAEQLAQEPVELPTMTGAYDRYSWDFDITSMIGLEPVASMVVLLWDLAVAGDERCTQVLSKLVAACSDEELRLGYYTPNRVALRRDVKTFGEYVAQVTGPGVRPVRVRTTVPR